MKRKIDEIRLNWLFCFRCWCVGSFRGRHCSVMVFPGDLAVCFASNLPAPAISVSSLSIYLIRLFRSTLWSFLMLFKGRTYNKHKMPLKKKYSHYRRFEFRMASMKSQLKRLLMKRPMYVNYSSRPPTLPACPLSFANSA